MIAARGLTVLRYPLARQLCHDAKDAHIQQAEEGPRQNGDAAKEMETSAALSESLRAGPRGVLPSVDAPFGRRPEMGWAAALSPPPYAGSKAAAVPPAWHRLKFLPGTPDRRARTIAAIRLEPKGGKKRPNGNNRRRGPPIRGDWQASRDARRFASTLAGAPHDGERASDELPASSTLADPDVAPRIR